MYISIHTYHSTAVRVCDTVQNFPHHIPFPIVNDVDHLKKAAADILKILFSPHRALPFFSNTDEVQHAIHKTAELLQCTTMPPIHALQHNLINVHVPTLPPILTAPQYAAALRVHTVHNIVTKIPRVAYVCIQQSGPRHFKSMADDYLLAQLIFAPHIHHIYNYITGRRESFETLLTGKEKDLLNRAVSNEFGRLAHGNKHGVTFTDTINFIAKLQVPHGKKVTYATFIFDHKPLKADPYRCCILVGGDKLTYFNDTSSPSASLLETKLLINNTI